MKNNDRSEESCIKGKEKLFYDCLKLNYLFHHLLHRTLLILLPVSFFRKALRKSKHLRNLHKEVPHPSSNLCKKEWEKGLFNQLNTAQVGIHLALDADSSCLTSIHNLYWWLPGCTCVPWMQKASVSHLFIYSDGIIYITRYLWTQDSHL